MGCQNVFNFGERFFAQIWGFEQFGFGAQNQIADIINVLCFQTISGTDCQFEFIDGAQ